MFGRRSSPSRDKPGSLAILLSADIQRDDADIDDAPVKRSRKDLWKSLRCIVPSTSTSRRPPAYDVHKLEFPNADFAEAFGDDDLRALWEWKQHTINEKGRDGGGQLSELPSGEPTSMWPSLDDDDAFIVFSDSSEDECSILHSLPTTDFDCHQDPVAVHSTSKKTSPAVTDRTYPESEDEWCEKRSAYSGSSISDSSQLVDQIKRVTAETFRVRQQALPLKDSPSVAKARSKPLQRSGRPLEAESKTQKGPMIIDFNPFPYSGTVDPTEKHLAKGVEPMTEINRHGVEQTIPALLERIRKLEAVLETEGISLSSDEEGESCVVDDDVGKKSIKNERVATLDHSSSSFMADSNDFSHDTIDFSPIRWDHSQEKDDDMSYTRQKSSDAKRDNLSGVRTAVLDKDSHTPLHKNCQKVDNQIKAVRSKPSSSGRRHQKGKKEHEEAANGRPRANDRQGNEAESSFPFVPPQPIREAGNQSSSQDGEGAEAAGLDSDTLSRFSLVSSWVDYTCGGGFME